MEKSEAKDGDPIVWPDMHDAWRLFCAMATQWRTAGMAGIRVGLEYAVLESTARSLAIPVPLSEAIFSDIRLMEAEALTVWSQKRRG